MVFRRWDPIGNVDDVHKVFARGLHLNVKKNEIWWPSRASDDPFPADVDRVANEGVKLLGAPIGTKAFNRFCAGKAQGAWRCLQSFEKSGQRAS